MYKCSDCGKITQEKPQYCDCGNNIFVEIDNQPARREKVSGRNVDVLPLGIFWTCIILAIVPWFFVLRAKPQETQRGVNKPTVEKKAVPNFNKLWDDSIPQAKTTVEEIVAEPTVVLPPKNDKIDIIQKIKPQPAKPRQTEQAKPVVKSPVKNLPPQKPAKSDVISRIEQSITEQPAQKVEQKPKQEVKQPQKPQNVAPPPLTAGELAELNLYKNNLRMVLLSKLNVQSIRGAGNCDIEFSINPSGKVVNRKFSKQSDNKTLNDAVYYMLMSVPMYQVPPKAYRGEVIRLHFYINNGYYEISFK